MAPRKKKISKEQYQSLIEENNVTFKGPTPPNEWPVPYQQHFSVIRQIWANRYDDYKANENIDKAARIAFRCRVNDLRQKALSLRKDININEATWRASVETIIIERFGKDPICRRCGDEKYTSEYVATYSSKESEQANIDLERKRAQRNPCSCAGRSVYPLPENPDDENGPIFDCAVEQEVSHDPNDSLLELSISMRPDRVVGLDVTSRLKRYISSMDLHITCFPLKGRRILFPFLIIEAKKESDVPGFRAIENQTAFPLRRLLKVQYELKNACELQTDPSLVWFFANQGEEWRLYAGTIENTKVRVYDLWHGTIESQDGALQLLQIVDYIWTWARDVYRPNIGNCLRALNVNDHEDSQYSTPRFRRSITGRSESTSHSFTGGLELLIEHETVTHHMARHAVQHSQQEIMEEVEHPTCPETRDASSDPFLRWANGSDSINTWTENAFIRHANIVTFSFRIIEILDLEYTLTVGICGFSKDQILGLYDCAMPMDEKTLQEIQRCWIGDDPPANYSNKISKASFSFKAYCQPEDWQITREIYCIIWPQSAESLGVDVREMDLDVSIEAKTLKATRRLNLILAFHQLRGLRGSESVWSALLTISLVLLIVEQGHNQYDDTNDAQWVLKDQNKIPGSTFKLYFNLFESAAITESNNRWCHRQICSGLRMLCPNIDDIGLPPALSNIALQDLKSGTIAVKSNLWPLTCPKFCFFVVIEQGFDETETLCSLLYETLKASRFFSDGNWELTTSDKRQLQRWHKALKEICVSET